MKLKLQILAVLFIILSFSKSVFAQDSVRFDGHKWQAPYHLPLPEKWTFERFLIPISFAPEIRYEGVEDIRFAPGWGDKTSDEYWSYSFGWWLDGNPEMNATIITSNLKAYYSGLMRVNIDAKKYNISADKLVASTAFNKTETAAGDLQTFIGVVQLLDYMQRTPITLNCLVHIKKCEAENKTIVFFELSPQAFDHKIWSDFKMIWNGFKCKK